MQARIKTTFVVHIREWDKPTNTARIAARMLQPACVLLRGGPSPVAGLRTEQQLEQLDPQRAVLLFPSPDAVPVGELARGAFGTPTELVVPDGTWSQTRRLVRRHAVLQKLPHVRLTDQRSMYQLRRGKVSGLLCTLEATVWALAALDPDFDPAPLLAGFATWQTRALRYRGVVERFEPLSP